MTALARLRLSLAAARELHNLESNFDDPPRPHQQGLSHGLRGGATVLALACFEGFLQELFEEELTRIHVEGVPLTYYSEKFQVSSAFSSLSLAISGDHDSKGKPKIDRLNEVVSIARQVGSRSFSPRSLALTQSNPNSATVKRMFGDIGCPDIFGLIREDFEHRWGPTAVNFVSEKLEELVRSRNRVAHTAAMAHIARRDVEQYLLLVEILSEVLSETLNKHVSNLIATARAASTTQGGP